MRQLKKWLERSDTSKAALANSVGVAPPTLAEWLEGDCLPSASSLMLLKKVTGLSVDELLDGCKPSPTRRGTKPKSVS